MNTALAGYQSDYLQLRHIMGHALKEHGRLISSFLAGMDAASQDAISVEAAVQWACIPAGVTARQRAARLSAVRAFAAFVHSQDPALAQIIPAGLIPSRVVHALPYIYAEPQVQALMGAALSLRPILRGLTLSTVIALMAATGMRISECLALNVADVDLGAAVLTVTGKRGHKRLVPIHPTTVTALSGYLRSSRNLTASADTQAFFLNFQGTRSQPSGIQSAFRGLTVGLGYRPRPGGKNPRLHDLRHTFATNALIRAHREGADVDARVAVLATYLGHVSPSSTYWYLSFTPELLELAARKVDAAQQQGGLLS